MVKNKKTGASPVLSMLGLLSFVKWFVRNGEFFSAFPTARSEHSSAIFCCHTASETMLISSFAR
jgi:hypothetical protein